MATFRAPGRSLDGGRAHSTRTWIGADEPWAAGAIRMSMVLERRSDVDCTARGKGASLLDQSPPWRERELFSQVHKQHDGGVHRQTDEAALGYCCHPTDI